MPKPYFFHHILRCKVVIVKDWSIQISESAEAKAQSHFTARRSAICLSFLASQENTEIPGCARIFFFRQNESEHNSVTLSSLQISNNMHTHTCAHTQTRYLLDKSWPCDQLTCFETWSNCCVPTHIHIIQFCNLFSVYSNTQTHTHGCKQQGLRCLLQ